MNNSYQVALAHYLYFPREDSDFAKRTWDMLTQRYGLTATALEDALKVENSTDYEFPVTIRNEQVEMALSILRGIIVIGVVYKDGGGELSGLLEELERMRRETSLQNESYLTGETTLVVSQASQDIKINDHRLIANILGKPVLFMGEAKGGSLSYLQPEENRHYYSVRTGEPLSQRFVTTLLPNLDAYLFKLDRQARFFSDQRSFIKAKKTDNDRMISDILHKWAGAKTSSEQTIELLEEDVNRLSLIYSELAGSLTLVKNAQDTIVHDLKRTKKALKELFVTPESIDEFATSQLERFENLLKQLQFDDELLHRSLDDTRATIDVIRTRIDLERGRESILLQKEGVSIQAAAGLIELVVVGFYTLETWELLASTEVFEHIPAYIRLGLDVTFAVTIVAFTHYIAKYLRKEKAGLGFVLSGLGIVVSAALMITASRIVW